MLPDGNIDNVKARTRATKCGAGEREAKGPYGGGALRHTQYFCLIAKSEAVWQMVKLRAPDRTVSTSVQEVEK